MKTLHVLLIVLTALSFSCSTSSVEEFVVGENFIHDTSGIMLIDTMTIKSSSFKYDSIISNSAGRLLTGSNFNSFSGYKTANAFFEMKFDDDIINTSFVFDSLCLILNYDQYYSGDTTVSQTINIHQLTQEMELGDDSYLYNTSSFKTNATALGSVTFKPKPMTNKSLSIRLSDTLGKRLAEMIKQKRDTITSEDLFMSFFKGLMLKTVSETKGAIVGFGVSSADVSDGTSSSSTSTESNLPEMRLYYHLSPNPNNERDLYYTFSMRTDGIYFNQIQNNSSGTVLENIADTNNELGSGQTNNYSFIQSGVQYFTKIDIPYVDNLLQIGKNAAFISASIKLYPVKGSYKKSSDLPNTLYVYSADRLNKLKSQLTLPGTTDIAYASLNIISGIEETVYYSIDISSFIDTELKEELETNSSLMIGYESGEAKKTAGQFTLGGPRSGIYSPKLSIYYYHN